MNYLLDDLPNKIRVGEEVISINSDYKTCLRIIQAFQDERVPNQAKIYIMINLLYRSEPKDIEAAINKAILFLDCGEEPKEDLSSPQLYSWNKDSKYIFNAINEASRGKLEHKNMHWWEFVSYFMEIKEDSFFSRILYYRKRKSEGKLTKEEQKAYKAMRDILELDIPESECMSDKESEADNAFWKAYYSDSEQ